MKKLLLIALLASPLYGDQISVSDFKGLNTNDSSAIMEPSYAQDALNVEVSPGGKSVHKRSGYGVYKTVTSTQAIHGGYHFFDSSGNDVQIWGSSTSLYGIVSDGSPATLTSTATLNATWDCTDTQGFGYCVDSSRDALLRVTGSTSTWFGSVLGTMIEVTPDRLVVAGVSGSANTLFFSGANSFTNFTTALAPTDPFTEVIAAPGGKLTHIRWACGKLLWWKDQSFGYLNFSDQYNLEVKTVSDVVGTLDNTSAVDPGGSVWFRGQDSHIWRYDCSALTKETIEISPTIALSGHRTAASWTQTSQSDFQTGASSPTLNLSFTISAGDVVPTTFTVTDTTSADFSAGTQNNTAVGAYTTGTVNLTTNNSGTVTNPNFESAFAGNWTSAGSPTWSQQTGNLVEPACTVVPQSNNNEARQNPLIATFNPFMVAIDQNGSIVSQVAVVRNNDCTWRQYTLSSTGAVGKRVIFRFTNAGGTLTTSDSYIFGGDLTFWAVTPNHDATTLDYIVDNIALGSSTITTGSFTSQVFNTGMKYGYVYPRANWTVDSSTPSFVLQQASSSGGTWSDVTTSTGINVAFSKQFLRYLSTFTITSADNGRSTLDEVTLPATSSGTYYSAVHNAPNLTAWSTFSSNKQTNGGSHTFYVRSATNTFSVLSGTPAWVAQTDGALITASTGTYFQVIDSFSVTSATDTPKLNDFTVNWFEGSAADQAYMLYFDNAIWVSLTYGSGQSANNYIFRNDLINDGWVLYNFGAGGMLVQNNLLHFGDTSTGNIFRYGTGTSDNGSAISAYWKSKDFAGNDPFLENQYKQIDSYLEQNSNQSLTVAYSLDTSTTSTSYTVDLSSTTKSLIRNKKLLPNGKTGGNINVKFSDNTATSSWELFGYRIGFDVLPYRPSQ